MTISNAKIDEVLGRFAAEIDKEEEKQDAICLSNDQKFEFRMAFRVIAGEHKNSLPPEKIYELFLTLGLTFQDSDIERLAEVIERVCGIF